jgi:hypothetical protein
MSAAAQTKFNTAATYAAYKTASGNTYVALYELGESYGKDAGKHGCRQIKGGKLFGPHRHLDLVDMEWAGTVFALWDNEIISANLHE